MDLGLKGKWALVCGSSTGLGFACAHSLAQEGVNLVMVARTASTLAASADRIRQATGVEVIALASDVSKAQDRLQAVRAAPQIDILINNAGGPKPADFRELSRDDWLAALDTNMLAPLDLINLVIDPMIERGFGRIVNITSIAVKAPVDMLILSNGARAGLTGAVGSIARQVARHNVTINNALPGRFDTDRLRSNNLKRAQLSGRTVEQEVEMQVANIPARRLGVADEFGQACAFLCSRQAGYISGQNILIDGGLFPGLL
ncbi:SDR family oxidoreductase [Orrella sp. NBD-18]|uniref:SDR family oxidoreductase n=1 Tax=Sheuella amnicola TaxID=2707330 RepID=A0A6B2QZA3_9BURK|nr:SDR family oxidoreductase [Sheuella amnicola]NDY83243.1 SDR family oxidoreductase [Sheuella amnicola]HBI83026.1 3-oxoacyl-ACP reductase [Alcaligenaceae bacterium]